MPIMQTIHNVLYQVSEKMGTSLCIMDQNGKIMAYGGAGDMLTRIKKEMPTAGSFVNEVYEDAETGCTWTRLRIAHVAARYLVIGEIGEAASVCAKVVATMLQALLRLESNHLTRQELMQEALTGNMNALELNSFANESGLDVGVLRSVVLFELQSVNAEVVADLLAEAFSDTNTGEVVRLSDTHIAAVLEAEDEEELQQTIEALAQTMHEEIGHGIIVGCGRMNKQISQLPQSLSEARQAIEIAKKLGEAGDVFYFKEFLVERILMEIPMEVARKFYEMVFADNIDVILSPDLMDTVHAFFDSNLNQSLSAKRLNVHRNTLYYRLEKVLENTGVDMRNFNDAVLMKLMMILSKYIYGATTSKYEKD